MRLEPASELHEHPKLKLVVLLHDFEQLDPIVVQDLFYICRFVASTLCRVVLYAKLIPQSSRSSSTIGLYPIFIFSILAVIFAYCLPSVNTSSPPCSQFCRSLGSQSLGRSFTEGICDLIES